MRQPLIKKGCRCKLALYVVDVLHELAVWGVWGGWLGGRVECEPDWPGLTGWTHRAIGVYCGAMSGMAVIAARRRLCERAAGTDVMDPMRTKLTKEAMGGRHSRMVQA